ncbi:transposase [Variovorax sp. YR752]|uniref:IS66 family transposase n=1 Tax=Variovorax sp. YR752 TaxID=1884383 RepID=UPI003137C4EF
MSQISFSDAEQAGKRKKTRREVFLAEMELVVPWKALLKVIEPHYPVAGRGRRPYEQVMTAEHGRIAAGCLAHARRKFDELLRDNGKSAVATEALQRIARIYRIERELATLTNQERLARRTAVTQPLWEELHKWLRLERARVHDGSATAKGERPVGPP